MNFPILLLLFVLPLTFNGLAQSSLWKHYGAKQGLSETTINTFAQDKNEILWLGGQTGLEYFDGKRFKKVKSTTSTEPFINSLITDKFNNVWAGTRDGIWFYNLTTKRFHKKHGIQKGDSQVYKIKWNNDSTELLIASSTGPYKMNLGGKLKRINSKLTGVTFDIYEYGNEYVAAYLFKLIRFNEQKVNVLYENINGIERIDLAYQPTTKSWLFVTDNGLYNASYDFNKINRLAIQIPWESKYYSDILYIDNFNHIWINKYDTLYQFNNVSTNKKPVPIKKHYWNNSNPYSISKSFCLYMDKDGNLWNSLVGSGVAVLNSQSKGIEFTSFSELNSSYVWTLYNDQSNILYGTAEGVRIQVLSRPWESQLIPNPVSTKFGISNIQSFNQQFWAISTYNSGVWLLDKISLKYIALSPKLSNYEANGIEKLNNGNTLIFSNSGIYLKKSRAEKMSPIGFDLINSFAWKKRKDNSFVVTTARQFLIINSAGAITDSLQLFAIKNHQLINSPRISINETEDKHVLIGTLNNGLLQLNWRTKTLKKIPLINTPASIYGILPLGKNEWLLTTNKGLYYFDSKSGISKQANDRNHLNFNDFNQFGFHISTDKIYVCGAGGILSGTSEDFRNLFFDEAQIQILSNQLPIKDLTLNPGTNFLDMQVGLSMKSTVHNPIFRYRLDGLETNWKTITNAQTVRYDFLPPGDYNLQVELIDPTHILANQSRIIPIHVLPHWWNSTWFIALIYLLSVFSIGLIFNYFYKLRLNWKLKQIAMEQQVNQERMRISRELHDNIGTQLSYLITGLETSESMVVESANTGLGEKLNRLQDTARISMQQLRDAVWVLNKEEISGTVLFQRFKEWALKMGDNYPIHMQLAHELPEELLIDSSQTLPIFRILQEAVHNTLKHAEASQLNVHFFFQDKALHIHLKDNGRGYTTTRKDGNGLINMNVRATEIGAKLTMRSEIDKGTELVLIVPIK